MIVLAGISNANLSRPNTTNSPTEVWLSIYIVDLDNVSSVDQNFTANVYIKAVWKDPRLKHSGDQPISKKLDDVWNPRLQFINQQRLWATFSKNVTIDPDGTVTFRQRVWGDFSQPLKLKNFPFDKQKFNIQVVPLGFSQNEVKLVQNPKTKSGMADEFSVADWEMLGFEAKPFEYHPFDDGDFMQGFQFSILAKRKENYYVTTIIIPLILIVIMSWAVFWIDPKQSGTQMSVGMTTMLTLIAFRFAVVSSLPNISYLTKMDILILGSTILVFASLVEVVATSVLALTGKLELARWIDKKISRWLFPFLFLIMIYTALF